MSERFSGETSAELSPVRKIIELPGGTVEMVRISPEQPKTDTPLFVAPGWAANSEVFERVIEESASLGRETLAFNTSEYQGSIQKQDKERASQYFEPADVSLRKVAALIEALEEEGIEKIDAVAHSEGGIWLALAAYLYPDKFRNVVLVNPGGMVGEDSVGRLSFGLLKDLINQKKVSEYKEPIKKAETQGLRMFLEHPIRLTQEALSIPESQIHELLKELKAKGVGVSVIHGTEDATFPMEKVQQIAKADQVDGFYSVKGLHNMIYLDPSRYMGAVDEALEALERKKAGMRAVGNTGNS